MWSIVILHHGNLCKSVRLFEALNFAPVCPTKADSMPKSLVYIIGGRKGGGMDGWCIFKYPLKNRLNHNKRIMLLCDLVFTVVLVVEILNQK